MIKDYGAYSKALTMLSEYHNMSMVYSTFNANQCLCLMGMYNIFLFCQNFVLSDNRSTVSSKSSHMTAIELEPRTT